jgi:hypothetical protein
MLRGLRKVNGRPEAAGGREQAGPRCQAAYVVDLCAEGHGDGQRAILSPERGVVVIDRRGSPNRPRRRVGERNESGRHRILTHAGFFGVGCVDGPPQTRTAQEGIPSASAGEEKVIGPGDFSH